MKRIWASIIIFFALITICIIGTENTKRISTETAQTITEAKTAQESGNNKKALELSETAVRDWHDSHENLCMYLPHGRLEAIEQTLSGLPMLCKYGASDQFMSECDKSLDQLSYLTESEIPNLQNIF